MICPNCGYKNQNNERYCPKCGTILPETPKKSFSRPAHYIVGIICGTALLTSVLVVLFITLLMQKTPSPDPPQQKAETTVETVTETPAVETHAPKKSLNIQTLESKDNQDRLRRLASVGADLAPKNSTENLAMFILDEFHTQRWNQYPLDDASNQIVPEEDILEYLYDTFGLQLEKLPAFDDSSLVWKEGDKCLIANAEIPKPYEFNLEDIQEVDSGFKAIVRRQYISPDSLDEICTLSIEENPESSLGYNVTKIAIEKEPLTVEMLETSENQKFFERMAYVGAAFDENTIYDQIETYVFHEFTPCRYKEYPRNAEGYWVVPKEDVFAYVYDTFGLITDEIPLSTTLQEDGENYLIGGATGGDIREFTFKEAYSIDGGFEAVVECYADYPAENTSGYNHTLDYTYTLTLKEQPDTSRGFVVTKLTFYRNSEPPAETTSYESPADSYDLPAPHPNASNTSEV